MIYKCSKCFFIKERIGNFRIVFCPNCGIQMNEIKEEGENDNR